MLRSLRAALGVGALTLAVGAMAMIGSHASASQPFARFDMIASPGISSCLPNAVGHVSIASQGVVEIMK
ncbi:MAG TPA: hypothetical protein VH916_08740, partial [Dehalococcoidia bacterium]